MKVVIVGAGPAGVTAAETLRENDREAEVVMLSAEPGPPYSPPAMLQYFTTGSDVHLWKGRDFAERWRIDYRPATTVETIDPEGRLRLDGGGTVAWDRLVLASGARLYAPLPGQDKPGIYNFKSLTAAEELMAKVRGGRARSAIIVGAGFIGVEIGLVLAGMGLQVTQLVRSRVMRSMLDEELSQLVQGLMEKRGVRVLQGAEVDATAFAGEPRVEGVQVKSGEILQADLVVAATGLKPNIEYLAGTGVTTGWGVPVDDHLQTSIPGIYAAGDLAETADRLTGRRYIHGNFPNAVAQGRVVGYNLVGWDVAYDGADSMNSLKHLGLPVMAVGEMEGEELRVRRKDSVRKLYLRDGRIVGFRLFGDIRGAGIYRTLMNKRVPVAEIRNRLLEPGFGMGTIEGLAFP